MMRVEHVRKRFGGILAVDDVSFQAADGRVTAVLGPNGAGKTTTLRMLTGLLRPDRGRSLIDGRDPVAAPVAARRLLGAVPDSVTPYERLTPAEHLAYAGRLRGLTGGDLATAIDNGLELFELGKLAGRPARGFSHGERRRLALAQALVHDPPNVVLDEPTNGLDVMSIRVVRRLIRRLAAAGKCVILSTHVMQEVAAVCDRVVIVAAGRVVAEGTPDELRSRAGESDLEEAFVRLIGTEEGLS